MKSRVIEHINFIEAATEEIKKLSEELRVVGESLATEEEEDTKISYYQKYKSLFSFVGLLYKDLEVRISSFIECYTCAKIAGESFSKEEDTIYEKYLEANRSNFVLSGGKIEAKEKNLFDMISTRFEGDRDKEKAEALIKLIKNK